MRVNGWSQERIGRLHLEDLRRQAFARARLRRARGRLGARIAATLRALAERIDVPERAPTGPWYEDVRRGAAQRA